MDDPRRESARTPDVEMASKREDEERSVQEAQGQNASKRVFAATKTAHRADRNRDRYRHRVGR